MVTMPQPKPANDSEKLVDYIPLRRVVTLYDLEMVEERRVSAKIREWCLTKMREEGIDV